MIICHVNEIREEKKTHTAPAILLSMVHLQKLTTVLGNEVKSCDHSIYILYPRSSKDLQRTLRESSTRPVVSLSVRSPAVNELVMSILVQYCRTDTTREWLDTTRTTRTGCGSMVYGLNRSWINGDMHMISNTALQPRQYDRQDPYGSYGSYGS